MAKPKAELIGVDTYLYRGYIIKKRKSHSGAVSMWIFRPESSTVRWDHAATKAGARRLIDGTLDKIENPLAGKLTRPVPPSLQVTV